MPFITHPHSIACVLSNLIFPSSGIIFKAVMAHHSKPHHRVHCHYELRKLKITRPLHHHRHLHQWQGKWRLQPPFPRPHTKYLKQIFGMTTR